MSEPRNPRPRPEPGLYDSRLGPAGVNERATPNGPPIQKPKKDDEPKPDTTPRVPSDPDAVAPP